MLFYPVLDPRGGRIGSIAEACADAPRTGRFRPAEPRRRLTDSELRARFEADLALAFCAEQRTAAAALAFVPPEFGSDADRAWNAFFDALLRREEVEAAHRLTFDLLHPGGSPGSFGAFATAILFELKRHTLRKKMWPQLEPVQISRRTTDAILERIRERLEDFDLSFADIVSLELRDLSEELVIGVVFRLLSLCKGAKYPPANDHDRILSHAILTGVSPPLGAESNDTAFATTHLRGGDGEPHKRSAPQAHLRNRFMSRTSSSSGQGRRTARSAAVCRTLLVGRRRLHEGRRASRRPVRGAGPWPLGNPVQLGRTA